MSAAGAVRPSEATSILEKIQAVDWNRLACLYVRVALAAAFLSAVASRFGLWHGEGLSHFSTFIQRTAEVNSFMPSWTIPTLAYLATAAEILFSMALLAGIWPRWTALGAAILLAMFGTAMAISFGIKEPLDYSVFSASAAALLLAINSPRRKSETTPD
jgi:putative oxidoreductase